MNVEEVQNLLQEHSAKQAEAQLKWQQQQQQQQDEALKLLTVNINKTLEGLGEKMVEKMMTKAATTTQTISSPRVPGLNATKLADHAERASSGLNARSLADQQHQGCSKDVSNIQQRNMGDAEGRSSGAYSGTTVSGRGSIQEDEMSVAASDGLLSSPGGKRARLSSTDDGSKRTKSIVSWVDQTQQQVSTEQDSTWATDYWSKQAEKGFEVRQDLGQEINSAIAGASKVFFRKHLNDEEALKLMESSKIPSNCKFLKVMKVNKEIWCRASTPGPVRSKDVVYQRWQECHAAMTANSLRTADCLNRTHEMYTETFGTLSDQVQLIKDAILTGKQEEAKELVECLSDTLKGSQKTLSDQLKESVEYNKDGLILAGKTNTMINKIRREAFRPSLPEDLKEVAEEPTEEPEEFLFGDNLKERVLQIKGDKSVRNEFEKKEPQKKPVTTNTQQKGTKWVNSKVSQKPQGDQYQKGQPKNNNNNNKRSYGERTGRQEERKPRHHNKENRPRNNSQRRR